MLELVEGRELQDNPVGVPAREAEDQAAVVPAVPILVSAVALQEEARAVRVAVVVLAAAPAVPAASDRVLAEAEQLVEVLVV
jgi:hypothetical protein